MGSQEIGDGKAQPLGPAGVSGDAVDGVLEGSSSSSGPARGVGSTSSGPADTQVAATEPTQRASRLEALRQWARSEAADELLIIVSLLALCVLARVLVLQPIEIWGDAGQKWHFARQWAYENTFYDAKWTHHMARFGVNVPTYLVQRLVGTSATAYYVAPVAMFAVQVLLVYLVGCRLSGRAAGVLGALLLIFWNGADRSATQLLPDVFEAVAAMLVAYFLIRVYEEDGKKRLHYLIAVGFGLIWQYMIKESSVLIIPGIAAAVWLSKRRFKDLLIVGGIFAGYVLLETACFTLFTPSAHRFAIVQSTHGQYAPITFWQLFDRFTRLEPAWHSVMWMWVPTVLWHLGSPDRRRLPLVLLPASFLFFLTFLVKSIDPLQQWTAFKSRYLVLVGPFLITSIAVFAVDAGKQLWSTYAAPGWHAWPLRFRRAGAWPVVALCTVLGVVTFLGRRGSAEARTLPAVRVHAAILNDAFRRNLPIYEVDVQLNDGVRYARGLSTVYAVYMADKYLAKTSSAKPGWLPDILEGVRYRKSKGKGKGKVLGYVLRDESAYRGDELERWIDDGCAVRVTAWAKKSRVQVAPEEKLPERCVAPRGTVLPKL